MNYISTINDDEEKLKINDNSEKKYKNYENQENKIINNYISLIKFLLVILLLIGILLFLYELNKYKIIPENNKKGIWQKGRKYIDTCLKGLLINNIPKFPEKNIPLISVVIPVYNANKTITSSIRSIQNQKMINYEIILVNDFSEDNTTNIIKNLQKEDPRIKIINNNKNMGTLYSRCVGALGAKGKYIFPLDNDDMLFVNDILDTIYEIASNENFDIVGFKSVFAKKYNATLKEMKDGGFYNHKHNLIVHQPELGLYPISRNNVFQRNDFTIWAKCIKTEIYQKAVNAMGVKRYSINVSWAEDTSMIFIIFNIAQSFKFVRKYGLFHLETYFCASFTQSVHKKTYGEIFLTDIVYEFSKNNTDKNFAAFQALDSIKRDFFNVRYSKRNSIYLKNVIKKILGNELISEENKKKIREKFSKLKYYNQIEHDEYIKNKNEKDT